MPELKRFTPAEASKTLPLVKGIVQDILQSGKDIRALHDSGASEDIVDKKNREITSLLSELQMIGCEYKDWNFEIGLVDFLSVIDGQDVYLCWKSDEPSLLYYHGIHEGFAGRKLIPQQLVSNNA